jgi:cell division protein YceG involved in septum cleavage
MIFMPEKKPIHQRAKAHITKVAGYCDEWCQRWRFYDRLLPTAFLAGILCFLVYFMTVAPPLNFPGASLLKVEKTDTLDTVAQKLKAKGLIHSDYMFELTAKLYGASASVVPGEYFFPGPQSVITVGRRLARGDYELIPVRVTIPEGTNTFQMANILASNIPDFDKQAFVDDSQAKEGYLFPDTYFFLPGQDPLTVITTLEDNFKRHISDPSVQQQITASGRTLTDIVTMASLSRKGSERHRESPHDIRHPVASHSAWHAAPGRRSLSVHHR